jgi:hypothetical protein
VMCPIGGTFDLATLMQQIVGRACPDPSERLELCHAALTTLPPEQRRIVLIIDDAHLLTEHSLRYLDLVVSVAGSSRVPLQVMLAAGPAIWGNLPPTGALAAENVACRVTLEDTAPALNQSESPLDGPLADVIVYDPDGESPNGETPSGETPSGETPSDAGALDASPEAEQHAEDTRNMVAMVRAARSGPTVEPPRPAVFGGLAMAASVGLVIVTGGLTVGVLVYNTVSHRPAATISVAEASREPAQGSGATDVPVAAKPEVTAAADTVPAPTAVVAAAANVGDGSGPGATAPSATQAPAPIDAPQADAGNRAAQPDAIAGVQLKPSADAAAPVSPTPATPRAVSVAGAIEGADQADRPGNTAPTAATSATPPVAPAATPAPAVVGPPVVTPAATTIAVPRPPTPSAASTPPAMAPEVVAVLITRGDELLSTGDVTAARLMYGRAAAAASADGAAAMGMTFDPTILPRFGVRGLEADRQQATIWYQRAADLGSSEARQLLKQLRDAAAE